MPASSPRPSRPRIYYVSDEAGNFLEIKAVSVEDAARQYVEGPSNVGHGTLVIRRKDKRARSEDKGAFFWVKGKDYGLE